jgi:hypothetical protein
MDFQPAVPSIVRDVRQRALLNAWLQLSETKSPPTAADFHADRFQDKDGEFGFYEVVPQQDGSARFRIDHDSRFIARAFGSIGRGQFMDDYIAPNVAPVLIPSYRECASRGQPIYTVMKLRDEAGRPVSYQRLLLPFAEASRVNRIMTSLKLVGEGGGFELGNLLSGVYSTPVVELAGVIQLK